MIARTSFNGISLLLLGLLVVPWGAALGQSGDRVVPSHDVTSRVVVRAGPTALSTDRGSLRPGESAELLGSVPNWYQIRLDDGIEGFVSKRWTRVVSEVAPAAVPGPEYTIDVVDVGTGLAVLVRGRDFTLVFDAGSNDDQALGPDNRMLAFMTTFASSVTTLDHLILSHPHTDHVLLLADLLAQYQVRHVWDSGRLNDICGYRAFITAIRDEPGVEYHTAVQHGGTRDYAFGPKQCRGQSLPAAVVQLGPGSRIDQNSISLGAGASMTFLHADGGNRPSFNANSLVVRLDLAATRVLLTGDTEAGGRSSPTTAPAASSIEGILLACCQQALAANVLVVAHHGSLTSSRRAFLDAVMASIYVVSSGPTKYATVQLPDAEVISELESRGQLFRTDVADAACAQRADKIGPKADGKPGGCTNIRITIPASGPPQVSVLP
ncbi:MAG: MBL fold metallo-hydrolase [Gemmatimonadota bacterium]|nr:MBL fold metallo-hydrolase [Gemmatimonadota bacterium]